MAVRVWRECLAASLVLALGACSGKADKSDADGMTNGAASGKTSVGKPGKPGQGSGGSSPSSGPTGGTVMVGSAGTPYSDGGGGGGITPDDVAGAGGEAGGAPPGVVGIVVGAPGEHSVHESYGTVQMQVMLTAQPLASVQVELASADTAHAVVFPLSLTFTPENWAKAQVAIVAGVRDSVADGGNTVTIETLPAVSKDPSYQGLDADDLDVFVIDETDAGIVVGSAGNTSESGATTTFNIVLTSQPTATVTIPLSSDDSTEGTVAESVTFEPSEWNMPHPVTVTGVDDQLADGAQVYKIITGAAISTDPSYSGLDPADVSLSNLDDDS